MKKRIVIVVGIPGFDYSNEKSAVASFLRTIKSAFEQDGHNVQLGINANSAKVISSAESQGSAFKNKLKSILKLWNWLYQSIAFRSFFKRQDQLIVDYLKLAPADLVVEFHTVGSSLGMKLSKAWGCKFSVVFDSPVDQQFLEMYNTKTVYWSRIQNSERLSIQAADHIMAYSPACVDYLNTRYKIKGEINVLPCIVDKASVENRADHQPFKIGFIGSFLVWHKVDLLVNVFVKFLEEVPDSRLQLIGFGEEWNRVKSQLAALGIQDQVDLPGFVDEEKLLVFKKEMSVAVMPGSNWYGSPLKLFEYASCGIPFIAPSTPTILSIFKRDEDCFYIDPADEFESLLNALRRIYTNRDQAAEMANRAKDFVRREFETSIYQRKLVAILN